MDVAARLDFEKKLLALEEKAQRDAWQAARAKGLKALEAEGFALRGLLAKDDQSGVLGRVIVSFERTYGGDRGGFRLGAADPVIVRPQGDVAVEGVKGIVRRLTPRRVDIVFDEQPEDWVFEDLVACEIGPSDVTFQRLRDGIDAAAALKGGQRTLLTYVQGLAPAPPIKPSRAGGLRADFNAVQNQALDEIAAAPPLFLLHGPPGTGKTTVLVQAIVEAVARGERVLAGAPSNQAVDNLANALVVRGVSLLRLGHPSRMDPALLAHTVEGRLEKHPQKHVARDLVHEARKCFREAHQKRKQGRADDAKQQAAELRREGRRLMDEARALEEQALNHILASTPVVVATLTGLRDNITGPFALGVIDEATQATPPAIYPVLTRAARLVLAGDHLQLGPTVVSPEAARQGLATSTFEALLGRPDKPPSIMLEVQYRMHPAIMAYPSESMYGGRLVADASVQARDLGEAFAPLTFVDTAGRSFDEAREEGSRSYFNAGEAALALQLAGYLQGAGVAAQDIGILSPYDAQVQKLREQGGDAGFEINSIDGFQGREKEVIIVSLVRSNERQQIGFLSETRRLNVALTRAKRALIVIGDSATITAHAFYRDFVEHAVAAGAHRSAWDFA